jgi:hypothetical protein
MLLGFIKTKVTICHNSMQVTIYKDAPQIREKLLNDQRRFIYLQTRCLGIGVNVCQDFSTLWKLTESLLRTALFCRHCRQVEPTLKVQ